MNLIQYLNQLKNYNKKIFYLILFISFIYIENFIIQITDINYLQFSPFTGYGMYSEKIKNKNKYTSFLITINNKETIHLWKYSQQNRHLLCQPLLYFRQMQLDSNYDSRKLFFQNKLSKISPSLKYKFDQFTNNPEDSSEFKNWYKRYLEQTTHKEIHTYQVQFLEIKYTKDKKILVTDTINFIKYQ